jgi:hypothetical protein
MVGDKDTDFLGLRPGSEYQRREQQQGNQLRFHRSLLDRKYMIYDLFPAPVSHRFRLTSRIVLKKVFIVLVIFFTISFTEPDTSDTTIHTRIGWWRKKAACT